MVNFRLDGRSALVTGANRGIGRAVADGLAELGATVYGTSRTADGTAAIEARLGTRAFQLDLQDVSSFAGVVRDLHDTCDAMDILVNNAGVNDPCPALEVTPESWDLVHGTNLRGSFFFTQAVARHWVERGRPGAVVNMGSQAGTVGIEERAAYCASKSGLDQLTKVLAIEWATYGIRVNTVAPTFIRTELTESTLSRPGWSETLLRRIPAGRFGEPDDVVGAVAYLAGDAARLVTGHTLLVDGGYTAL